MLFKKYISLNKNAEETEKASRRTGTGKERGKRGSAAGTGSPGDRHL